MRYLIVLFFISISSLQSQELDYNLKKGVAVEGYDVVAYFENQAVEGNKKIATIYNGVKYLFSSQKNLNTFLKDPEKYTPQYGGYCAYAIGVKAKKVGVNPKTFEIRNGKLYLFYNAWGTNTLELWLQENPNQLLQRANTNWKKIKYK